MSQEIRQSRKSLKKTSSNLLVVFDKDVECFMIIDETSPSLRSGTPVISILVCVKVQRSCMFSIRFEGRVVRYCPRGFFVLFSRVLELGIGWLLISQSD